MWTPEDLDFRGVTSRYSGIEGVVIDPAKVPEAFRHLIPLAKHWSIGDDVERHNLMRLTPDDEVKALVLAVRPFTDAIWNWCSSHDADIPVPDEVVVFEALAQAAAEAEQLYSEDEE
jgi:hypothetical protein